MFKKPDLLGLWKNPLTIPCLESRDEMRVEMRGENYATLNEDASSLLWHSLNHAPPFILSATKIRRTTDLSGQNFAVN